MFNYKRLLRVIDAGADTFEDYNSDEDLCFTTDSQPPTTGGNGEMATGGNPLTMKGKYHSKLHNDDAWKESRGLESNSS